MRGRSSTRRRTSTGRSARLRLRRLRLCRPGLHQRAAHLRGRSDLRRVRPPLHRQGAGAADRQPARSGDGPGTDGRREGGRPHPPVGAGGAGRWRARTDRRRADGLFYPPTVLVDVPKDARVCGEEVFAPVVNLFAVPDFAAGLAEINDSASSACRAASSPATSSGRCRRTTSWRSAASSSTMCPPGGSTTCPTAA